MNLLISDNLDKVSDDDLQRDLELLPDWRREIALRYKFRLGQIQSSKAYLLLCQGLKEFYGISDKPRFGYEKYQKPFLPDYPQIHFNLSHCKEAVMCVINDVPIGCDVESVYRKQSDSLIEHCFNETEISQIKNAEKPEIMFTELWTRKEAVLKCSGRGLNDDLPHVLEHCSEYEFVSHHNLEKGYVYSVCCRKIKTNIHEK